MDFEELVKRPVIIKRLDNKTESFQVDKIYNQLKPDGMIYDDSNYREETDTESSLITHISFKGNNVNFSYIVLNGQQGSGNIFIWI